MPNIIPCIKILPSPFLLHHKKTPLQVVAGQRPCYIMFLSHLIGQRIRRKADAKVYSTLRIIRIHMNKADIINNVHEALGITKSDAEKAVETMLTSIVETLVAGQEVSIAGLGIFSAKMRNARTARNPRTGEAIEVPAMRVPKFRAAKALKDAVK
jgi:DNA-binding protein HU-beta